MSIWQTQSWQDMLIASGQAEEYFIIERETEAASSLLKRENGVSFDDENSRKIFIEKRRVSLGEYGLFVIGFEGVLDLDSTESLEELCKEEKCLFVQVETIDYYMQTLSFSKGENSSVDSKEQADRSVCAWKSGYYKKFIPPYTALIDLTQSEDEILAAMKPKGRYNIKLARKKGVIVEQVDAHIGNIKKFHSLMCETTARDTFAGNTREYYRVFLESLDASQMFFAYHEQELIAAGIFIVEGNVMTYYYGASSSHKRNLMAPYLLQWTAIEHAKKRGLELYDFLGVAGDDEKNSSLSGVTDFKMKLSPNKTLISGSSLFVNKKWKYLIISLLKKLRN